MKRTFQVHFQQVFNVFCSNLESLPDNQAKNGVREFSLFASFKVTTILVKRMHVLFALKVLTAR